MVGSIDRTHFEFTLDNDPTLFDSFIEYFQPIVYGMGLCDDTDRFRIGMALKEALLNALLHGNLELKAADVRGLREEWLPGEEPVAIRARLAQPEFARRRIRASVSIDADQAVFVVRDQGRGFDTSRMPAKGDLGAMDAESGRGIVLMRAFMDEVMYNASGNEVTLIKRRGAPSVGSTGAA